MPRRKPLSSHRATTSIPWSTPNASTAPPSNNAASQLPFSLFLDESEVGSLDLFASILDRVWSHLRIHYFPERTDLSDYTLEWSSRKQKRVLASCDILGKRVRVARELARPEYLRFLSPLLYHEMCHAVIGREVETRNGARLWHGPQFKGLEARHPDSVVLQQWISAGGWATAVRRDRAFASAQQRRLSSGDSGNKTAPGSSHRLSKKSRFSAP